MQRNIILILTGLFMLSALYPADANPLPKTDGPVKVEIMQTNGGYQLLVDHQPFYIKGAGLGSGSVEELAQCGANSFRTWNTSSRQATGNQLLDRALTNGLYVTLGLEVARERLGFNYDDPVAVSHQLERIKAEVIKYKDHPALIIWAIGNELNLNAKNPKVWDAVNDISKMIHQVDPNHLTTTPLAGFNRQTVEEVKRRAPDLDLLSFQMYGDIVNLPQHLRDANWPGPYLITEWGATGHWEVQKTDWGAPIEDNSTVKANFYTERFEKAIAADRRQCLGSYVFLWGQKQERTPTWYGMFLESGEATACVDAMEHIWTGSWPVVRSPQIDGLWLDEKQALQNVHLRPERTYTARVEASDPNQNPLTFSWDMLEESTDLKTGGDFEHKPQSFRALIQEVRGSSITLEAPGKAGAYRLFVYVYDGKGRAAHANLPFFVDQPETLAPVSSSKP